MLVAALVLVGSCARSSEQQQASTKPSAWLAAPVAGKILEYFAGNVQP